MQKNSLSIIRLILKWGLPAVIILMGLSVIKSMTVGKEKLAVVQDKKIPIVDALVLQREDISLDIEGFGTVRSQKEMDIMSELTGEIIFVHNAFVEGGFVKKDDIIIEFDPEDYSQKLNAAVADVNIVRATIEELKQQHKYMNDLMKLMKQKLALAKAELKRQKLSRKKGHISAQQLEKSQSAYIQNHQMEN